MTRLYLVLMLASIIDFVFAYSPIIPLINAPKVTSGRGRAQPSRSFTTIKRRPFSELPLRRLEALPLITSSTIPTVSQKIGNPYTNTSTTNVQSMSYTPYPTYLPSTISSAPTVTSGESISYSVSVIYSTSVIYSYSVIYSTTEIRVTDTIYDSATTSPRLTPTTYVPSSPSATTTKSFITFDPPTTSIPCVPTTSTSSDGITCDGSAMGSYKCLRDGQGFAICNWGSWQDMGATAAGTVCEGPDGDAEIVATG